MNEKNTIKIKKEFVRFPPKNTQYNKEDHDVFLLPYIPTCIMCLCAIYIVYFFFNFILKI